MTSQTLLGHVASVTGSTVSVFLTRSVESGIAIIDGSAYRIGQVGSFVRIPLGYQDLFGVVSEVGASAAPATTENQLSASANWIRVELVGEAIGASFERGISQHPSVNDAVHLVTLRDLARVYGGAKAGQVPIGRLSSAENVIVRIDLEKLLTRHSAVLGSTGSGKSTTVASLLRSIAASDDGESYPSARILLLDVHGEYASALSDIATVFRINPGKGERELTIPYWALEPSDLVDFVTGGLADDKALHVLDKIVELKTKTAFPDKTKTASPKKRNYEGVTKTSLTIDTPIPYSLKRLWHEMIDVELRTLDGPNRDQPALLDAGDASTLTPPRYKPHAMGSAGPFINSTAPGLRRQLGNLRSRLLDRQYDFLLHPGPYEPDFEGATKSDLSDLLRDWLGQDKPVTILDMSGVPSPVMVRLIGSILKVIYEALFWSREKTEGGVKRPLLIVMEEAHRYLSAESGNSARDIAQRIVKEGRKYGIGAMVISQRPSEVDDTILSQCGTFVALRLSNPVDRAQVKGTLPDGLGALMDMLPILRTGEAIITGEAATLPLRCRITLPGEEYRPNSQDPRVADQWRLPRRPESYDRVAASWRAQSPRATTIGRKPVRNEPEE